MKKNQGAIRSKRLLTGAFFELLKERPHKRMQIKELCERAGVARPTFYAHYQTIDDIPYEYYVDLWLRDLGEHIDKYKKENLPPDQMILLITEHGMGFWGNQVEVYRLLKASGMESVVFRLFQDASRVVVEKTSGRDSELSDPMLLECLNRGGANMMFMIFDLWLETGMEKTAREMAEIVLILHPPDITDRLLERFG